MDLWNCALGFADSQVLLTAEEVGVFDCLADDCRTAEEVAQATGLPAESAQRLLTALCALGIVAKSADGRFSNGPEAAAQLVRGRPEYIGDMFDHVREHLYPVWNYLKEALLEGAPQWHRAFAGQPSPTEDMYGDAQTLRAFMDGMHNITYELAVELAWCAPELADVGHIVDIGGASGAFVIALAQRHRRLKGTVVDLPQVQPIAEDYFATHALKERLDFAACDFFNDPLPHGADAYSLGFILHDWDTDQGSLLLSKVSECIDPGGMLIIGEYLLNEDRTGPLHVARSDLNMLVAARGRERTAAEYAEWMSRFGFRLRRVQTTSKGKSFLIAGRV